MIRSSQRRWLLSPVLAAALALPSAMPEAQQPAAQRPLPNGYTRQLPVQAGQAPKMTVEEKAAAVRVFSVRFGAGDEILSGLYDLVAKHRITSGHITGIGGLAPGALLGWGDPEVGGFKKIAIEEKTEIVSLIGDIAMRNGEPYVHVHMIVGSSDGSTKGGHLIEGRIAPLGELTVVATSSAAP
jgi:predicted DNA-binding protein with PD1-like motif